MLGPGVLGWDAARDATQLVPQSTLWLWTDHHIHWTGAGDKREDVGAQQLVHILAPIREIGWTRWDGTGGLGRRGGMCCGRVGLALKGMGVKWGWGWGEEPNGGENECPERHNQQQHQHSCQARRDRERINTTVTLMSNKGVIL